MLAVKNIFLGLAILLVVATQAFGGLTFKQTVVEDVVSPDDKSYPFEFAFENTGAASVEISEIKTTCGCTTAELEKMTYAPGESGIIKGTFSVGNRQGKQEKKVHVLTKDLAQPEVELSLKLNIPQLVTMKPSLLLWRVGSEPKAKTLTIRPNIDFGAEILSVECESPDFAVENLPLEDGSNQHEVVVAPLKTEESSRGLIKVQVAVGDAEPKTIYAHALIR